VAYFEDKHNFGYKTLTFGRKSGFLKHPVQCFIVLEASDLLPHDILCLQGITTTTTVVYFSVFYILITPHHGHGRIG
jgi:hypothetical protein